MFLFFMAHTPYTIHQKLCPILLTMLVHYPEIKFAGIQSTLLYYASHPPWPIADSYNRIIAVHAAQGPGGQRYPKSSPHSVEYGVLRAVCLCSYYLLPLTHGTTFGFWVCSFATQLGGYRVSGRVSPLHTNKFLTSKGHL